MVKNPPANTGDIGGTGSTPRPKRSPGEGNGTPLQYSRLDKPVNNEYNHSSSFS